MCSDVLGKVTRIMLNLGVFLTVQPEICLRDRQIQHFVFGDPAVIGQADEAGVEVNPTETAQRLARSSKNSKCLLDTQKVPSTSLLEQIQLTMYPRLRGSQGRGKDVRAIHVVQKILTLRQPMPDCYEEIYHVYVDALLENGWQWDGMVSRLSQTEIVSEDRGVQTCGEMPDCVHVQVFEIKRPKPRTLARRERRKRIKQMAGEV